MEQKYYCQCCDIYVIRPAEWKRHILTNKHKRMGEKSNTKCEICDKNYSSHFLYKIHYLSQHCTKEERSKTKYYCSDCDLVFISKLYLEKHLEGKRHNDKLYAHKSVIEENIKYICSKTMTNILKSYDNLLKKTCNEINKANKIISQFE